MKIAQSVTATQQSQLLASSFEITASPMPGHTLDEILGVIDEELAALQAKPPDAAELERAKNQLESDTVRSLEGLLARAERLQSYNYLVGDPGFLAEDLRQHRGFEWIWCWRVQPALRIRLPVPKGFRVPEGELNSLLVVVRALASALRDLCEEQPLFEEERLQQRFRHWIFHLSVLNQNERLIPYLTGLLRDVRRA